MPIPAILAGLGAAAASPLGQAAIGAALPYVFQGVSDWWRGPQAPGPESAAAALYLQQMQQMPELFTEQQRQQLMNEFQQQTIPDILERLSAGGGQRSSALGQQLGMAGTNLATNLGALGEQSAYRQAQLNQQRLAGLGGYLAGQQGLGLQAQQLGQAGTIAQREAALRALGLMGGHLGAEQQRMGAYGNVLGGAANVGMGQQADILRHAGQASAGSQFGQGVAQGVGRKVF